MLVLPKPRVPQVLELLLLLSRLAGLQLLGTTTRLGPMLLLLGSGVKRGSWNVLGLSPCSKAVCKVWLCTTMVQYHESCQACSARMGMSSQKSKLPVRVSPLCRHNLSLALSHDKYIHQGASLLIGPSPFAASLQCVCVLGSCQPWTSKWTWTGSFLNSGRESSS